jgi:hypothetical protein
MPRHIARNPQRKAETLRLTSTSRLVTIGYIESSWVRLALLSGRGKSRHSQEPEAESSPRHNIAGKDLMPAQIEE